MTNLRMYGGKVPLPGSLDSPIKLVDFPSQQEFIELWGNRITAEAKLKYFEMLSARVAGKSMKEVALPYGISRERIRQIEAKFIRLLHKAQKTTLS